TSSSLTASATSSSASPSTTTTSGPGNESPTDGPTGRSGTTPRSSILIWCRTGSYPREIRRTPGRRPLGWCVRSSLSGTGLSVSPGDPPTMGQPPDRLTRESSKSSKTAESSRGDSVRGEEDLGACAALEDLVERAAEELPLERSVAARDPLPV